VYKFFEILNNPREKMNVTRLISFIIKLELGAKKCDLYTAMYFMSKSNL